MKAALVEYEANDAGIVEKIGSVLQKNHLVLVKNFPPSKDSLATFCKN